MCAVNWRLESFYIVFAICSKRSIISLNVFSPPKRASVPIFEKSHLIQKDVESVFASPAPKSEPRIYEGVLSAKGVDSCYRKNVPVQLGFFALLKSEGTWVEAILGPPFVKGRQTKEKSSHLSPLRSREPLGTVSYMNPWGRSV